MNKYLIILGAIFLFSIMVSIYLSISHPLKISIESIPVQVIKFNLIP